MTDTVRIVEVGPRDGLIDASLTRRHRANASRFPLRLRHAAGTTCRSVVLLLAASLLGGCVWFEVAPVEQMGCDTRLAGRWQRVAKSGSAPVISVNTDCEAISRHADGTEEKERFHTFEFEGHAYMAIEAGETKDVRDEEDRVLQTWPANRIILHRYRLRGDRLYVWVPDPEAARALGEPEDAAPPSAQADAKAGKPLHEMIENQSYFRGDHARIARLLREHGDALYGSMDNANAIEHRRPAGQAEAKP